MYSDKLWVHWSTLELKNYKEINGKQTWLKKGYTHFDNKFWFPNQNLEIKEVLQSRLLKKSRGKNEAWSFMPFLKILIKTPRYKYQEEIQAYDIESKIRPISFASHKDSLIFGFYSHAITKIYENYIKKNGFSTSVLAYRTDLHKSNIQFANEVFLKIKDRGECSAIALDIKGYFDNIDHLVLKDKWVKVLEAEKLPDDQYKIYKAHTKYSYVNKLSIIKSFNGPYKRNQKKISNLLQIIPGGKSFEKFDLLRDRNFVVKNSAQSNFGRKIGIPQGSPMSALLSNIYLIDYDKALYERSIKQGFTYVRYCDDILIICDTDQVAELENFAIKEIEEKYYQKIQTKKTEIIDFRSDSDGKLRSYKREKNEKKKPAIVTPENQKKFYKSLQYLGFEFNGHRILIRGTSLSRYYRKMKARIEKTIAMSYSPNTVSEKIFTKQLLEKYSHFGKRNFIAYAINAGSKTYKGANGKIFEGMNSSSILKQVSRHMTIMKNELINKNEQRLNFKSKRQKKYSVKEI